MADKDLISIQYLNSIQKVLSKLKYSSENYDCIRLNSKCRKVQCIETGEIYKSVRQDARKTNSSAPSISLCCQGKQSNVKGYHWKYLK